MNFIRIVLPIAMVIIGSSASFSQGIVTRPTKPKTVQNKTTFKKKAQTQQSLSTSEMFERGNAEYEIGNYSEAVTWYRKAAEQGNADSQNALGSSYYYGYGVSKDYSEAIRWFRKAAEQGYMDAQYNLAVMYDKGEGIRLF